MGKPTKKRRRESTGMKSRRPLLGMGVYRRELWHKRERNKRTHTEETEWGGWYSTSLMAEKDAKRMHLSSSRQENRSRGNESRGVSPRGKKGEQGSGDEKKEVGVPCWGGVVGGGGGGKGTQAE